MPFSEETHSENNQNSEPTLKYVPYATETHQQNRSFSSGIEYNPHSQTQLTKSNSPVALNPQANDGQASKKPGADGTPRAVLETATPDQNRTLDGKISLERKRQQSAQGKAAPSAQEADWSQDAASRDVQSPAASATPPGDEFDIESAIRAAYAPAAKTPGTEVESELSGSFKSAQGIDASDSSIEAAQIAPPPTALTGQAKPERSPADEAADIQLGNVTEPSAGLGGGLPSAWHIEPQARTLDDIPEATGAQPAAANLAGPGRRPKLAVNPNKVSSAMDDRLTSLQGGVDAQEDQQDSKKKKKRSKGASTSLFGKKKAKKSGAPLSEDEWKGDFDQVVSDFQAQDLEEQRKEAKAQLPKSERIKSNILAAIKEPIVIIAVIVVLFVVFVQKSFLVPSESMKPTLMANDRIFTIKSYITNGQTFKPGDIVCFYAPNTQNEVFVKRVIANGGSTVEISGDNVYVDGELSPFQGSGTGQVQGKWELAEDEYFVMGDNRTNSKDSRFSEVGKIKADAMISRVIAIYWPFDDAKLLIDNPYPAS